MSMFSERGKRLEKAGSSVSLGPDDFGKASFNELYHCN